MRVQQFKLVRAQAGPGSVLRTLEVRSSLCYILSSRLTLCQRKKWVSSGGSGEPQKVWREHTRLDGMVRDCKEPGVTGTRKIEETGVQGWRPVAAERSPGSQAWPAFGKESGKAGPKERWLPARRPAPPAARETRSAGGHRARGGGVPGPPRPAAANPDGAHVLAMARLPSRQQPQGQRGGPNRTQVGVWSPWVPGGGGRAANATTWAWKGSPLPHWGF